MINNFIIEGYVQSELTFESVPEQKIVCNFSLAVPRYGKAKEQKKYDYFKCVAWNRTAKNMIETVKKGYLISLIGKIETGDYIDRSTGETKYTFKVIVSDFNVLLRGDNK